MKQLKRIGHTISHLNQGCEEMRRHINAAHRETAPVLEEALALLTQREQNETKQQLLQAFNAHFIMSDDDVAVLTSTAEPVNDRYFAVLARAKRLQSDCEILLGTENQSLGLEILEQVSRNLNGAFQKLYRWIQREFKSLNLENPQISSSIRRALRVLAERPSLFQNCLDYFAEAREHILSDAFFTALTGTLVSGEEDKSVKPIELVAHDPLRYVGDMLAWTHSATVSEREALEVLFISEGDEIAKGIQAGRDNEPWHKYSEDEEVGTFDGLKALNELVDRDVTGVARVLRQRIEQVIQTHEETIMAYKIANLLNFYRVTFSRLLGHDSVLLETLAGLEGSALRQFRALLRDHVASLQGDLQHAPADLGPPDFLQDCLKQLTAIMKTYETSFTTADSREKEFEIILVDAFDPYMAASNNLAESLPSPANTIFSINCLLAARTVLLPFNFTKGRVAAIDDNIAEYSEDLVDDRYRYFLQSSGLQPLLQALEPTSGGAFDLSRLPSLEAFQPQALIDASQILDGFLPSALMDAMENLKQLQSSKLAREITEKAADRFCEDFETVEDKIVAADKIMEPSAGLEDEEEVEPRGLRALFPRTSGEIRVLLT
jgi:conserved oligomeric Golgi complex subunit 6